MQPESVLFFMIFYNIINIVFFITPTKNFKIVSSLYKYTKVKLIDNYSKAQSREENQ